ncbi:MAG: HEAT repeat domain-containing protein [Planctomycetia bacterium]|nr:HEAT repeat domain-containing protein [Planctomycetia bacterium]
MTEISGNSERFSPDDALPKVTPPSAKFLIPLFVIPFCIVTIIVLVWALFSWLAQQGGDPRIDIDALARDNAFRWQAAHNLADALRNPRHAELREDHAAAGKVAEILKGELAKPLSLEEEARGREVNLQMFLCRALGEFHVTDGVSVLIEAARPSEGNVDEQANRLPVRLAALEAMAVLLGTAHDQHADSTWAAVPEQLLPSLLTAADYRLDDPAHQDEATQVRMRAAFNLGLEGSPTALARLERLLVDPSPDVRYNAAAGLARNGDVRSIPLLCDMLDPAITEGVQAETVAEAQPAKRLMIYETALQAIDKLAELNTQADLAPVLAALERLANTSSASDQVRVAAKELAEKLATRPPIR